MNATQLHQAVRDGLVRGLAIVGLAGIALIHVLAAPGQFEEALYLGWMYVALIAASIAIAGALLRGSDPRVWLAAGGLALSVVAGYVLSRTTGLPGSSDDIGDWTNQLGLASLFVEGAVISVSAFALLDYLPQARFHTVAAEVGEMTRRELAQRFTGGIEVTLYWSPGDDSTSVEIWQEATDERFAISVAPEHALDAFNHPFAHLSAAVGIDSPPPVSLAARQVNHTEGKS